MGLAHDWRTGGRDSLGPMTNEEIAKRLDEIEDAVRSVLSEVGALGSMESKLIDIEEHLANIEAALWPEADE